MNRLSFFTTTISRGARGRHNESTMPPQNQSTTTTLRCYGPVSHNTRLRWTSTITSIGRRPSSARWAPPPGTKKVYATCSYGALTYTVELFTQAPTKKRHVSRRASFHVSDCRSAASAIDFSNSARVPLN